MSARVAVFSVLPSPYQRDLFGALSREPGITLEVFYLEAAAPESPYPQKQLAPHEHLLPGHTFASGPRRWQINWRLPERRTFDLVVMNSLMSITAQYVMRTMPRHLPWLFWGERLGHGGALHRLLRAPLHRATGIVAIGSLAERDYAARFPEPRLWNIPYHCALTPFQERPRVPPVGDEVRFIFCGQMIARKGVDLLLQAFAQLPSRARLLLVGREAELPGWLAALPGEVRARIEYAGFQAPEALPEFFARADVFVLPSRYDGWGVVVNQALGAGLPLLCSDAVGAAYDLIEPRVNGLSFPASSAEALREAMQTVMADPQLPARWGAAARARAAEWTPEAGARKWAAVLESILHK